MKHLSILYLILSLLCSCGPSSIEEYKSSAAAINRQIYQELKTVQTREELLSKQIFLKKKFIELAEVIIAAAEYSQKHPDTELNEQHGYPEHVASLLREELERIYQIDGCREIVEKSQEMGKEKLDTYERRKQLKVERSD